MYQSVVKATDYITTINSSAVFSNGNKAYIKILKDNKTNKQTKQTHTQLLIFSQSKVSNQEEELLSKSSTLARSNFPRSDS